MRKPHSDRPAALGNETREVLNLVQRSTCCSECSCDLGDESISKRYPEQVERTHLVDENRSSQATTTSESALRARNSHIVTCKRAG